MIPILARPTSSDRTLGQVLTLSSVKTLSQSSINKTAIPPSLAPTPKVPSLCNPQWVAITFDKTRNNPLNIINSTVTMDSNTVIFHSRRLQIINSSSLLPPCTANSNKLSPRGEEDLVTQAYLRTPCNKY